MRLGSVWVVCAEEVWGAEDVWVLVFWRKIGGESGKEEKRKEGRDCGLGPTKRRKGGKEKKERKKKKKKKKKGKKKKEKKGLNGPWA